MPSNAPTITPAWMPRLEAPTPTAAIDSPSAMITIRPCRSAKWAGSTSQFSVPRRISPP